MLIQNVNNVQFAAHRMTKKRADYLENEFKQAKKIDVITHESSDRDGANSALVLADYLNQLGVQARVIVSQRNLQDLGLRTKNQSIIQAKKIKDNESDVAICVDFSKLDKLPRSMTNKLANYDKVYCFDHHSNPDIAQILDEDAVVIGKVGGKPDASLDKKIKKGYDPNILAPIYVDTSAKAAAGVIYRYLEALGHDLDEIQAYNLFSGFCDDTQKRGLIKCDGIKGTIKPTRKLMEDRNSYEIFKALKSKLSNKDVAKVARTIDIMCSLNEKETKFNNSLYKRLKFSKNGKVAYIEIPANDKEWLELGMDNPRTSTILNRFRQKVIRNDFKDKRLDKIKTVFVFYRANDVYRMSVHSKEDSLLDFFKYIEKRKIPDFTMHSGGHQSRAGGKTLTVDEKECHAWVQNIISCDDFYN